MREGAEPLTIGTAGHVDHGKTALVRALTGVDTDRLPEEKRRELTIVLGYARLELPSGRHPAVIDVPGHERFVRTMVAGATGIDAFVMVVAADDGVMPQTVEHATVLGALDVRSGLIVVTKSDLADPAVARGEAEALLPGVPAVACSTRTGAGLDEVAGQLAGLAAILPGRAGGEGMVRLHVDRAFTIEGRGTVVTGTLWSGGIEPGDRLELQGPKSGHKRVRVRGVQVHDAAIERAAAGQRVAVNLSGVRAREVVRGDVLATPEAVTETVIIDCALELEGAGHGDRVQVHHGTRDVAARLCFLDEDLWQLRLEQPLAALAGDRLVVRRLAPPATLGGGRVLDAAARRHGRRPEIIDRLAALRRGEEPPAPEAGAELATAALAPAAAEPPEETVAQRELEQRLRDAGPGLLSEAQLQDDRDELRTLRERGRAVRVGGRLYAHAEVADATSEQIVSLLRDGGPATLAEVRDALGLSRKSAQAFLEYLDSRRLTRRLPDDRRVLIGAARPQ
jgi:selenocysteine-specific elongation factor